MKTFCDDLQSAENLSNIWSLLIRLEKAVCCVYKFKNYAWVVERSKATGCKPVGLISYVGSNPTPCTILILDFRFWILDL